jgi:hypothetical protein
MKNGSGREAAVDIDAMERELQAVVPFVPQSAPDAQGQASNVLDYATDVARVAVGEAPHAGELSADAMEQLFNSSAAAVENEVAQIVTMAASLQEEGRMLADAIRRHGQSYAADVKRFATLAVCARTAIGEQRERFSSFWDRPAGKLSDQS